MDLGKGLHSSQSHVLLREWQSKGSTTFSPIDFVLPLFVAIEDNMKEPVDGFPEVYRMGINATIDYLRPLVKMGLRSVLLFPVIDREDKALEQALDDKINPILKAVPRLKQEFPDLYIICDVCLCIFSPIAHCCVFLDDERIDYKRTLAMVSAIVVKYAEVGAQCIAPSGMIDGRVAAIRRALDATDYKAVSIMSYSAKYRCKTNPVFAGATGRARQMDR